MKWEKVEQEFIAYSDGLDRFIALKGLLPIPKHLPDEVILSCPVCQSVWVQTAQEALANPTALVHCPDCNSFFTHTHQEPPDTPHIVEG